MSLVEIFNSFVFGVLTPLTAACVIPLYPGYISYLSKQFSGDESRKTFALFGLLVLTGVLSFMLSLGLIFSTILQQSLTGVIGLVSPVAFTLLGLFSFLLILNIDFESRFSSYSAPEFENPLMNAFGFGFFFGAIIIPCNPAFISVFLGRALLFTSPVNSLMNFFAFGLGIGSPLLAFTLISSAWSEKIIGTIKTHETMINRASGLIMLGVSVYYLIFVFGGV